MNKNNKEKQQGPSIAPGIDDHEELEQSASQNEKESGEYTSVTTLSFDEVDPS